MRKISKAKLARPDRAETYPDRAETDVEFIDSGPGRVPGSTITSWPGPPVIDLTALFARQPSGDPSESSPSSPLGTTISGAMAGRAARRKHHDTTTVSLSDGTQITFATADPLAVADPG